MAFTKLSTVSQMFDLPARAPNRDCSLRTFFSAFVPLIIALGLLYPVSAIIRGITVEKELKQKELMKMMSVNETDIGWSWYLSFWLFHMVTAIAMSGAFKGFYGYSSFEYIFLLWFLGWTAIISFSMFLASFFSKATTATLVGLLVFFSGYFLTLAADFETGNSTAIQVISLHPIAAISYALQEIGRLEDGNVGLTKDTYWFANTPSGFTVGATYRMLILDSFLYGFLVFYFNRVIGAGFGQPLPWYFMFTISYWNPRAATFHDSVDESEEAKALDVPCEGVGDGLSQSIRDGRGVEIRNLRKTFGDKTAVDNLSLSMYNNQVTALLGTQVAGLFVRFCLMMFSLTVVFFFIQQGTMGQGMLKFARLCDYCGLPFNSHDSYLTKTVKPPLFQCLLVW